MPPPSYTLQELLAKVPEPTTRESEFNFSGEVDTGPPVRIGQTAGIDPKTGRVWFGDSISEIVECRRTEGLTSPLFFERVGFKTYFRKGGHQ